MRILTITSSYPKFPSDTTAPFIESITRELAGRGHELTVVLPARDDLRPRAIEGVRFRPYRYAPSPSLQVFGYAEALRADVALRGATYLVTPLAAAAGIWASRRELEAAIYDVVHAHWAVPSGAMAAWALGARRVPLVVSLHGSDVFLAEKNRMVRAGARRAFARAAAITACSQDLADRSRGIGAPRSPEVIPYGVDTELFRPDPARGKELRVAMGLAPEDPVILAVGRLVHKKGFEFLVDAVAELSKRGRRSTLVIAGKGDLEPALAARARDASVSDRVRLVGNVEREELPGYFSMADVVAVPSVRDPAGNVDGLPNVLLEAMAAEKAIVATRVGGIAFAARPDQEALLVAEKDPGELANAIESLLRSSERRGELGRRARRRALEDYGWKRAGERFESVLRSVT